LAGAASPSARNLTLAVEDPSWQTAAARIALNARDAGLNLTVTGPNPEAAVRLVEVRIASNDPARALASVASLLNLGDPGRTASAEELYNAERTLLEGYRAIPLFHLPDVYGAAARVKGGPGISPMGEWQFENLWLEPRP
jgi:hypothetical protein